jgi:hypothetical protein
MAARYWVGGTGTWSSGNTANWSTTSGGAGGASVPASADTPIFDANSGSGVVTSTATATVGAVTFNNSGLELSLGAAFTTSSSFTLSAGTLTTNNYAFTATGITSNSGNARTISLGSSTVSLSDATQVAWVVNSSGLTFNAGTSQINFSGAAVNLNEISSNGLTFYNVSFTSTSISVIQIYGSNIFNNLSFAGKAAVGVSIVSVSSTTTQTVNGTLTLSAGINAAARTVVRGNFIGTAATFNCAAVSSLTDIDFRDIAITGSASPISGTRLGDVRGNSGITFAAAKTVYWSATANANWSTASWTLTQGGAGSFANFPLAQDTILFQANIPAAGTTSTINNAYNIGTVDFSARTASITLSFLSSPTVCGNWVNNSFVTISGSGGLTFAGRGSQSITSAGKVFASPINISSPGGTVTLQDALSISNATTSALTVQIGTFSANGYNVTLSAGAFNSNFGFTRTVDIGSGTWLIQGSGTIIWNCTNSTNLTVTGSGTIAVNNTASRNFIGGGIQTYPHLRKDTSNSITITGSNKFARISNSVGITGTVLFQGGSTNEFNLFDLNGSSTSARLTIGSTGAQATLKKPTAWNVGTGSLDGGNNTGISFTAGDNNYLSVSYINGELSAAPVIGTGNFLMFFM